MAPLAQSVLVTGSNRGIGLELVRQLAEGPDPPQYIFATCRDPEGPGGKTLRDLAAKYPNVRLIQLDAVNLATIKAAVQVVESQLNGRGLNLLINNGAINSHDSLQSVAPQQMLSVFSTNVAGPLQVAKEFLPLLKEAAKEANMEGLSCSKAAIINMSSLVGSIELGLGILQAPMYPYRASKAALNMVTRCLAVELQEVGVLCTAIHPGWVKTDMGTEKAPLTVECSVQGILKVISSLSQATTGAFLDWEGKTLPW
ncbi:C-signal [Alligator mississippiensis]|uniref:C-factor-like n=1 Tax=Alligator mississippiensis TaxID=8496 RepID=A0A151NJN0_ALLMI|nr:C-signal [Alligator mississippiensis]KYO36998.1 C-factor-like [Alligator mississippiensis]